MPGEDQSGPIKTQVSQMKSIDLRFPPAVRRNRAALSVLVAAASCVVACSSSSGNGVGGTDRVADQSDFSSAPPGQYFGNNALSGDSAGTTGGGLAPGVAQGASNASAPSKSGSASGAPRKVEETDL